MTPVAHIGKKIVSVLVFPANSLMA
jgi:hypothetical protein